MRLYEPAFILAAIVALLATNRLPSFAEARHIMRQQGVSASSQQAGNRAAVRNSEQVRSARRVRNLMYHDGSLLPRPHLHAIYWGNPAKFPSDFVTCMNDFLQAYGGTGYTDIMTQYLAPRGFLSTLPSFEPKADSWEDTSEPAPDGALDAIGNEACSFAEQVGGGPDPNSLYVIMTSNFPAHVNFCAYHASWSCPAAPSITFPIAYLPNLNRVRGCYLGPHFTSPGVTNPYSDGVRSNANAAAHELSEVVTDPLFEGWFDNRGNEIGDKCNFRFRHPARLNDSFTWQIQELWSNNNRQCIQSE